GLVVGTVVAVNVVGLAAKPDGFAAPAAHGAKVALPPVVTPAEQGEPGDRETDTAEDPAALSGAGTRERTGTGGGTGTEAMSMPLVDPDWITRIAAATGIPERALTAYALAHVMITAGEPECGLDWTTIAAIGAIESGHGSHAGTVLDENGNAQPAIIGRALDGNGVATITDTDNGAYDGDTTWDRAVGPMQFIPSTWAKWGSDANGDGVADPNQIDDAARSAADYLCASGPMTSPDGWRAAVFSYNHDNSYVDKVATIASDYLASAG
ncbi:MAG TPA: lytic transglycosylase domain-containing protein, partial [Agromyces sp.]|nr:lytic transglycosylase domain-containing protein [Agromyces sp.]